MHTGISTACFYPEPLEEGFQKLLECGFQTFEVFINTFSERERPFLKGLLKQAKPYGAKIVSIHPFTSGFESFLLFSGYERRFQDAIEFYRGYFSAAAYLGARFVVLHGQRKEKWGEIPRALYFERYHALLEVGRTYGVTLVQENVNAFSSQEPAFLKEMREYLHGDCAFVLDLKQAVRSGHDPFEACAAMGEQLVHVHLNDHDAKKDCLLPGRGVTDYKRFARQLREQNYKGDLIIEVYRNDFGAAEELLEAKKVAEDINLYFDANLS